MLFFNTEFGIYLNSQSPGFKPGTVSQRPNFTPGTISQSPGFTPGTVSQSPCFKPGTVSQSPGFKPGTISQSLGFKPSTAIQSPGFKPGTISQSLGFKPSTAIQSPGFKPGTDVIQLPYFQTQAFKSFKKYEDNHNLINKELSNPDSLSFIEIRRSEVKSLSGSFKKNIFVCYYLHFISFFGKNKYFKKSHSCTHLIKGTAVGRVLWGANTFPTRNRLPNSKSGFANLPYLCFWFSIVFL